jgi:hypothetical protein
VDSAATGGTGGGLGEAGPPPIPSERIASERITSSERPRRRPRGRLALVVLAASLVSFVAGVSLADLVSVPGPGWRSAATVASERDLALVALLEGIVASEGIMLAFNDDVAERLDGVTEEAVALAAIASAAADGADGLRTARPGLVEPSQDGVVDDVRTAYVPHLDAWIDYLAALAEEPRLLFTRDEQQPYLLMINATAEDFADALEDLLAGDPAPRVAELAERILDEGFRSERDADV